MSDITGGEKTGIFRSALMFFERVLESRSGSNILIVILIVLAALPLLGIGVVTTRAAAPQDIQE